MRVAMTQAGLKAPLLAFVPDDDVYPFENVGHLFNKAGWWVGKDRHLGIEIVDSAGQRWVISGLVEVEAPKRRWWQFGRSPQPQWEIEVQPFDTESFTETRRRVVDQASRIFDQNDEALAAIRVSTTMADLSQACFQITARAQSCRILAGDSSVLIRSTDDVAERALILFALVRISFKADRLKIMEWLQKSDLINAISPDEPPLFTSLRLSDQQRAEAGWNVEELSALLWALGLADMPPHDDHPDLSLITHIVPPAADIAVDEFKANSRLRPPLELARMAETCRLQLGDAEKEHEAVPSDDNANLVDALYRRHSAIQWVLNPERLEWR